ncbi:MAG: glycoside hydrolase family 16 protein [Clostridiales bacterium]|jgi:beta-glucanase (GH16 family)|nr:glycoside hydrolase family 16 protein [Clostridiales bacterium]
MNTNKPMHAAKKRKHFKPISLITTALILALTANLFTVSATTAASSAAISVYPILAPETGNYPQSLFKYPYKAGTTDTENFTQTLTWTPRVAKVFAPNTAYTAKLTLTPANGSFSFSGITLSDIANLPSDGAADISLKTQGENLVITVKFEKTEAEAAKAKLVFSDEFERNTLDKDKWEPGPNWDRQGRGTWTDDMISLRDGLLRLRFTRDTGLGRSRTSETYLSDNWIRSGAIRSRAKEGSEIFFEHGYGYYEASIKFPKIDGTWGAFWLMSPTEWILTDEGKDGTEIDIVESIRVEDRLFNAALNWNGYEARHKAVGSDQSQITKEYDIYDGKFHTFALDWSPSEYIFYVDGIEFWRCDGGKEFKNSGINANPNYIKLSVEGAAWTGSLPYNFTTAEMLVDYVRVYNQPMQQQ